MVSKLWKIWSGMFIPDPDADYLPIPDPGSRGQKGTGSRIPDPQHCIFVIDPDPRQDLRIQTRTQIHILHFMSVLFKIATKNKVY